MKMKKCFFVLVIFLSVFSNMASANNQQPLRVVTSFSILENLVAELGGNHVEIKNLVGRNSDAHIYQPKPSDAVAIANADLVIMNGLAFEGWIARLMDNNGYSKKRLVASQGVQPLMTDDDIDPHAWQSFQNIKIYIDNISQALIELKPEYKNEFSQRNQVLMQKVIDLQQALSQKINAIPKNKRLVVTSHDAFAYLGRELNIQFIAPVGFSTDSKPTAKDVAKLIDQINSQDIKALFVENISSPRLLAQIASETDAVIGGKLYSDALSEMTGPAPTYLEMMRYNIESIAAALTIQEEPGKP